MSSSTTDLRQEIAEQEPEHREAEPLIRNSLDMSVHRDQEPEEGIAANTMKSISAKISQSSVLLIVVVIAIAVSTRPFGLFTFHPLFNSLGLLLLVQAVLLLQPTHTPTQKRNGTFAHFSIFMFTNVLFSLGFLVIEVNKIRHSGKHFKSLHAVLGTITYLVLQLQLLLGVVQYFFPRIIFRKAEDGKKLYKYHRLVGYAVVLLLLATVVTATKTDFIKPAHFAFPWVLAASAALLVAIAAGIRPKKMSFRQQPQQGIIAGEEARPPNSI